MSRPPVIGTWRALRLLLGLAISRWANRFAPRSKGGLLSTFVRRLRRQPEPADNDKREATPGKRSVGLIFFVLGGIVFLGMGWTMSCRLLAQISDRAEGDGKVIVSELTMTFLQFYQVHSGATNAPSPSVDHVIGSERAELNAKQQRTDDQLTLLQQRQLFEQSSELSGLNEQQRSIAVDERMRLLAETGLANFRVARHELHPLGGPGIWPQKENVAGLITIFAAFFLWLGVLLLLVSLGTANQDLGRVEWGMEWLLSFPLSPRAVFTAKLLEYTLINPFVWFLVWPLCAALYYAAGLAFPLALLLAAANTLLLGVTVAAIRLVAETWLRLVLSVQRLKNLQALCTVVGMVMMILVFWVAFTMPLPEAPLRIAAQMPAWLAWTPFALPARVSLLDPAPMLVLIAYVLVLPWLAVAICAHAVRGGVVVASGSYQGIRRAVGEDPRVPSRFRLQGIIAKDVTLLLRDRNFLVQTLVVPVLIVGMQLVINPELLNGIVGNYHHAATFAFMLGVYVLMASAFAVLAIEGPALWMLYTFPRELMRMLLAKTLLWCACAMFYAAIALALAAFANPRLDVSAFGDAAMAVVGVGIYAFIAAGIGALGTDPQSEGKRKISISSSLLFMLLSGLFAYAIYNPSLWGRIVQLVLSSVLAYALWQNLRDRLPYLLDPVDRPPPWVGFSDGIFAVLSFFVIQGVVLLALTSAKVSPGLAMAVAFVLAGVMSSSGMLIALWRRRVPDLLRVVGIHRSQAGRRGGLWFGMGLGLGAGLVGAGCSFIYLRLIDLVPGLRDLRDQAALMPYDAEAFWWFAIMAVLAAPVCEEFIFRGLVFRGLRRSLPLGWAACFSAAIFACVHSPLAALPVFILGLLTALVFEFSGWLVAPIVAHFTYNLVVLLLQ